MPSLKSSIPKLPKLETVIDGMWSLITEAEKQISMAEDKLTELDSRVLQLSKEKDFLTDKVDQLENQSRRNNVSIVSLQEGSEGTDPLHFFTDWIPSMLGQEHFAEPDYWMSASVPDISPACRSTTQTYPHPSA